MKRYVSVILGLMFVMATGFVQAEDVTITMSTWLNQQEVSRDMMLEIAKRFEE